MLLGPTFYLPQQPYGLSRHKGLCAHHATQDLAVDGAFAGTVSLNGTTMKPARVVFGRWLGAGTHTIVVKALGSARVDLDGFSLVR